jgi:hypothetical protein
MAEKRANERGKVEQGSQVHEKRGEKSANVRGKVEQESQVQEKKRGEGGWERKWRM